MNIPNHIEVVGESSYLEYAVAFIADVQVNLHTAKNQSLSDAANEIRAKMVQALLENDFEKTEILEGGQELWNRAKTFSSKTVRYNQLKITLKVKEHEKLMQGEAVLEELLSSTKHTYQFNRKQPVFEPKQEEVDEAYRKAFDDAKRKAQNLASHAEIELHPPILIRELSKVIRASGAYGDPDYYGDSGRHSSYTSSVSYGGGGGSSMVELESPTRTLFLHLLVRFGIPESPK